MSNHDELRTKLDQALRALPRPITLEAVKSTAARMLPPTEREQFNTWADSNGAQLLAMLNG